MKRLYQLALEAEDTTPLILDDVDDDIDSLIESQYGIDYFADGIKQAVMAADQLTKIADVVEAQTDQDACPEVMDTRILDVVLEGIYQQLGVKKPRELSLEDAEGTTWGLHATRLKEQISNILQAIIEALRRAYENLRSYLNKVFAVATRLEKYAAQQLRAYRLLHSEPTQETYESTRLAKALYCPDAGLINTYERLFNLVEDAERAATSGYVPLVVNMVEEFVKGGDITHLVNEFPKIFEKTFSNIFEHDPSNSIIDTHDAPETIDVYTSKYLPGGYLAAIGVPKTIDSLGKFVFAIQRPEDREDYGDTLKVLSIKDMTHLLDSVVKMCSRIRRFDAIERKNGAMVDHLKSATAKLKNNNQEVSEKDKFFLKSLASMAPTLAKGIHQQTFTFALSSFQSLVEHCNRSASFYTQVKTEGS